jgi:DNA-directed RNA polymerase specialized sigma24 family protein
MSSDRRWGMPEGRSRGQHEQIEQQLEQHYLRRVRGAHEWSDERSWEAAERAFEEHYFRTLDRDPQFGRDADGRVSPTKVRQALASRESWRWISAGSRYRPTTSLDASIGGEPDAPPLVEMLADRFDLAEHVIGSTELDAVTALAAAEPPKRRPVITAWLRRVGAETLFGEPWSYAELAEEVGVNEDSAKQAVCRFRGSLRRKFERRASRAEQAQAVRWTCQVCGSTLACQGAGPPRGWGWVWRQSVEHGWHEICICDRAECRQAASEPED